MIWTQSWPQKIQEVIGCSRLGRVSVRGWRHSWAEVGASATTSEPHKSGPLPSWALQSLGSQYCFRAKELPGETDYRGMLDWKARSLCTVPAVLSIAFLHLLGACLGRAALRMLAHGWTAAQSLGGPPAHQPAQGCSPTGPLRFIRYLSKGLQNASGFPSGSAGRKSAYNAGNTEHVSWSPGPERCPGEGNGNPLQYSCLKNPMDREAW